MTCKQIRKQLTGGQPLSASGQEHLASCTACAAVSSEQRAVSRSLEMLAAAEPPIGAADRAFRAAMAGEPVVAMPSFLERLLPIATPIAAAAAAAAAIALLTSFPSSTAAPTSDTVATSLLDDQAPDELGDLLALGDSE